MARYKPYSYDKVIPLEISFKDHILPGTIEHTIHDVVEHDVDMSVFASRYKNDQTWVRPK